MIAKMLLRKVKKQLDAKGLGQLPDAITTMLKNPGELGPVIAYVILAQCGIFDSLGFYFFFSRITKKLFPKKGSASLQGRGQGENGHAANKQKKEAS